MKTTKILTISSGLLLASVTVFAQESVVTSGGETTGSGGTTSYSIGQVFYSSNKDNNQSESQGVQQPFEVYIIEGTGELSASLELSVYPNPASEYVLLKTSLNHFNDLSLYLMDNQGKLLQQRALSSKQTRIELFDYPIGMYVLTVMDGDKISQSYKIVKNQ